MSFKERIHFMGMSFMHDTLYGLFMDAEKLLLPAGLQAGQTVLEVGCGPGFFTIPAAKIVGNNGIVHNIDINPFAIRKVEKKIKKHAVKNVKTALMNVTKTNFKSESIDLAFFFGVIHSLTDVLDQVINEMYRILKPNGTIAIQKSRINDKQMKSLIEKQGKFQFVSSSKRVLIFKKR